MTETSLTKTGVSSRLAAKLEKNTVKAVKQKKVQQELLEAINAEIATEKPEVKIQIPLFPEEKSAMPTKWSRTSLFSSVSKGRRTRYVKTQIASRSDFAIQFTGEQLDYGDEDVFLHAIRLAQGLDAGGQVNFVRSHFLKAIGRQPGTSGYKWLKESLQRLASATLFVENENGQGKIFRLIKEMSWNESAYWIAIDPEMASFYARKELAFIDFDTRLKMKLGMSRLMQIYVVGHKQGDWHYTSVDSLHAFYGASNSLKNFMSVRSGLPAALIELESLGLIEDHEFYVKDNRRLVKWWRPSDFGKWLRSYVEEEAPGWRYAAIDDLFGASKYRTLKSFLSPGKGLKRALNELEKAGIISKPEIYQEKVGEATILKVRWHREK